MATGRIVELDPETGRYSLPAEHAAWLTRAASPDNLAVEAQWIPTLSTVEDDIVECFAKGGGVPYERFARFHEVMAEESAQTVLSVLFSHILPLVPGWPSGSRTVRRCSTSAAGAAERCCCSAERFPGSDVPRLRPLGGGDRLRVRAGRASAASRTSASSSAT